MPSPVWKGQISYCSRSFAAKLLTGPRSETVSFSQIHKSDGSRVKQVLFCAAEDSPIQRDQLVKGYEYEKGKFVTFEDHELPGAAPSDSFEIAGFAKDSIDPLCFESAYFVSPGDGAEEEYTAFYKALRDSGQEALGELCIHSRPRTFVIRAGITGLVAHALYFSHERRALDEFRTAEESASAEAVAGVLRQIRKAPRIDFYPGTDYQTRNLRDLVESRVAAARAANLNPIKRRASSSKRTVRSRSRA
jgi:DNA end-binding protein Ku